ncbi:FimV/HubP family polar landmark protein [Paludibacterium purpuratum]|uniref:Pilus assembly protein FimV n=1 Tax=Paludibacterium purpuratum TaxID=1144873 RepID=A0A4R7BB51_9NEIS|nr:FimV/HubP family polar landmark protein [Paludibacterium purpuratum]TDR82101.1 pilus assembly protein FimV [Paludibacterium purpuratum]
MLRRFTAALAIALFSVCAWADFGPIRVYSRLGEPLRAEVALNDTESLDTSHWRIGLADRAAFDDLNFVYAPELSELRFSLHAGPNGPMVSIRSQKPIRTPYLQFVLQLRSSGTRWVKGFEVQLETRGEGDVIDVPPEAAVPTPRAVHSSPAGAKSAGNTLSVGKQDTLASLAAKIRPAGIRPSQAMAALYLANRAKFSAGDPPQPRAGAKLSIPSRATMSALSEARAQTILHPAVARLAPLSASAPQATPPAAAAAVAPAKTPESAKSAPAVPPPPPPLAASQIAAYAASDAAARAQIDTLSQQVKTRAQDLQKANQHISDLNRRIQSLQASEAAVAKLVANGINYKSPRVLTIGGVSVLAIALLFFFLGRRGGPGNGRKKVPKPSKKNPLASTGVAQPDPTAAEAGGKGDALAEAEVYLAYGHDEQAEEILRKALDLHPGRQDVRAKLLEIYAARPDPAKFEVLAREVHDAYDGRGAHWERARAMGSSIDPENPLYRPEEVAMPAAATPMMDFSALETPAAETEQAALSLPDGALDFSMDEPAIVPPAENKADDHSLLDFDFSLENKIQSPAAEAALLGEPDLSMLDDPALAAPAPQAMPADNLDWPDMPTEPAVERAAEPAPQSASGDVSAPDPFEEALALASEAAAEPEAMPEAEVTVEDVDSPFAQDDEALATKLDLARVYLDMGDNEGAREVLQELIREAKGKLKKQAEDMLAQVMG